MRKNFITITKDNTMFVKRFSKLITEKYKSQTLACEKLGVNKSYLSRLVNSDSDDIIIATLRNAVSDLRLTPEDLYFLITGSKPNTQESSINNKLLESQSNQIDFLKKEIERLHTQLNKTLDKIDNSAKQSLINEAKEGKERNVEDKRAKIPDNALH